MPAIQFKGKTFVQNHHLAVPYHQLLSNKENSLTDKISLNDNLIIQGDNLVALKALLPTYAGKIKCIYIDPPYNTGNEGWVYNDNVKSPIIKEWIGRAVGREGEDLTRHDKWLCMMMPRLKLLRELLSDDGVILISCDDVEQHNLRVLLDEIFGQANHLATLIWKSRQIVDSRNQNKISVDHEYIITYGKTEKSKFIGRKSDVNKYSNPDNDSRGPWMSNSILGLATEGQRPNLHYSVTDPITGRNYAAPSNTGWRYSRETMQQKIEEGRIVFPKKEDGRPREKKFLAELSDEYTGFSSIVNGEAGYTLHGTRELRDIFGKETFDFPKPSSLIKILVGQVADKDSIVLDSFAGSGTTAQAVLELNKEDDGSRKFILVEMEDYANDITAERIRRVIKGVSNSKNELVKAGLGGTFSYFELGDAIETSSLLSGDRLPSYEELARYVYFTATGEEFDASSINESKGYLGKSSNYDVYMYYRSDIEYLKTTALTLDEARRLRAENGDQALLVFAPTKYVEQTELDNLKITFCQLPFEIYKVQ